MPNFPKNIPQKKYTSTEVVNDVVIIDGECYYPVEYDGTAPNPIPDTDGAFPTCDDCELGCLSWIQIDPCSPSANGSGGGRPGFVYAGDWTGSSGGYWHELKEAVEQLKYAPQTINFSWTIRKRFSGNPVSADIVKEYNTQGIPEPNPADEVAAIEFSNEIQDAFDMWSAAFEFAFSPAFGFCNKLTVNFNYTGDENTNPSLTPGDFRIGMHGSEVFPTGVLAYATYPLTWSVIGDGKNSTICDFNSDIVTGWALDSINKSATDNRHHDILLVAAHEIGHSLGFGHNEFYKGAPTTGYDPNAALLFPAAPVKPDFNYRVKWGGGGLPHSFEDIRGIHEVYGLPPNPTDDCGTQCIWTCGSTLLSESSNNSIEVGDVIKLDGYCYEVANQYSGPADSIPTCEPDGTPINIYTPVSDLQGVFLACSECANAETLDLESLYTLDLNTESSTSSSDCVYYKVNSCYYEGCFYLCYDHVGFSASSGEYIKRAPQSPYHTEFDCLEVIDLVNDIDEDSDSCRIIDRPDDTYTGPFEDCYSCASPYARNGGPFSPIPSSSSFDGLYSCGGTRVQETIVPCRNCSTNLVHGMPLRFIDHLDFQTQKYFRIEQTRGVLDCFEVLPDDAYVFLDKPYPEHVLEGNPYSLEGPFNSCDHCLGNSSSEIPPLDQISSSSQELHFCCYVEYYINNDGTCGDLDYSEHTCFTSTQLSKPHVLTNGVCFTDLPITNPDSLGYGFDMKIWVNEDYINEEDCLASCGSSESQSDAYVCCYVFSYTGSDGSCDEASYFSDGEDCLPTSKLNLPHVYTDGTCFTDLPIAHPQSLGYGTDIQVWSHESYLDINDCWSSCNPPIP